MRGSGLAVGNTSSNAVLAAGIILVRKTEGSELEVLIGQYEVVNALKSERDRPVRARFPGEWHFPAGARRQADRGPLQTACREFHEVEGIRCSHEAS